MDIELGAKGAWVVPILQMRALRLRVANWNSNWICLIPGLATVLHSIPFYLILWGPKKAKREEFTSFIHHSSFIHSSKKRIVPVPA